jgi:hypothetical protein
LVLRWLLSILALDGKASADSVRDALGAFYSQKCANSSSESAPEIIQQLASEMNKSKRWQNLPLLTGITD